jgi:hypothetical protein
MINGGKIALRQVNTFNNTFAVAGQNVLSIDNYDVVSVSSKNASNYEKKPANPSITLEMKGGRSCNCKIKSEENKLSNFDKSSELASSKDQFSDKDSVAKSVSHTEDNIEDIKAINAISLHNVESYR